MIKNIKGVIAIIIAAVILIVALLLLLLIPPKDSDTESEVSSDPIKVYEVDKSKVTSIDIKNQKGEISLVKDGERFILKDRDSSLQNLSTISSVVNEVLKIEASQSVNTAPDDFTIYGLAEPKAVITITLNDGTTNIIHLGDEALNGGIYLKKSDNEEVFLIDSYDMSCYDYTRFDLYSTTTGTKSTNENIKYIKLKRNNEIIYELQALSQEEIDNSENTFQSTFDLIAPIKYDTNADVISNILSAIPSITFSKVITDEYDDALLEQYGLLNPEMELTYKYTVDKTSTDSESGETTIISSESFTEKFKIGKKDEDGNYYAMFEGKDLIYTVSATSISEFINATTDKVCVYNIYIINIKTVDNITIEGYGKTYSFDLINSDAENNEDMIVKYNNQEYSQEEFRKLYQVIIGLSQDGLADNPGGSPIATISFTKKTGEKDILRFYKIDDRNVFVAINGQGMFRVNKTPFDKIFSSCEKYINGEKIIV